MFGGFNFCCFLYFCISFLPFQPVANPVPSRHSAAWRGTPGRVWATPAHQTACPWQEATSAHWKGAFLLHPKVPPAHPKELPQCCAFPKRVLFLNPPWVHRIRKAKNTEENRMWLKKKSKYIEGGECGLRQSSPRARRRSPQQRSPSFSQAEWPVTAPRKWQDGRGSGRPRAPTAGKHTWRVHKDWDRGFFSETGNWWVENLPLPQEKTRKWGNQKVGKWLDWFGFPLQGGMGAQTELRLTEIAYFSHTWTWDLRGMLGTKIEEDQVVLQMVLTRCLVML